MPTPTPGWYPAPDRAGFSRYWDGVQWTDQYQSVAPADQPPQVGIRIAQGEPQWWSAPDPSTVYPSQSSMHFASFGARAGAAIVDTVLFYVVAFVVGATIGSLVYVIYGDVGDPALFILIDFFIYPLYFGVYWWYYATGWSPGRALVGIRIVDAVGQQPGARRGIGRLLMSGISGLVLGIGYLAMLWSSQKQTWHDAAAGTFVIRTR